MLRSLWDEVVPRREKPSAAPVVGVPADWLEAVRYSNRLPMDISEPQLVRLIHRYPERVASVRRAAANVIAHRFTLLGATDFVPDDPDRPPHASGYRPIDWRLDPVSGLRFPTGFQHSEWNMQTMRPGSADIKLPWELARCQHWSLLGQAWRLTGDARFAEEIGHQLRDFVEANPVGVGVNWVCTMDVALRAANWALALQLIRQWRGLDADFWSLAYERLLEHGHFIRNNLEDKYEVTSNHFLSNVAGLLYVAAACRDRPEGQAWLDWCVPMLEREINVQVLDDGADFESSIPYHRLVTELFLGVFVVCRHAGRPLSAGFEKKLAAMVTYLIGVMRPDGLMPQVGDADDGRLHILSGYGTWNPQDARHLLGPAAAALNRPEWACYAGSDGVWETTWWGFDADQLPLGHDAPSNLAHQFSSAGHIVSRRNGNYLLVTNAIVGTKGFGNHKHNDQLGFELHCDGRALIVDPGSHVYTSNPASRNKYRGTAFHNTLMIDGVEQNKINPEWLFRLFEKSNPEHVEFSQNGASTRYRGRHHGYARLPEAVIHERAFEHHTDTGALTITDRLEGAGNHQLHWHFHLAPGIEVRQNETTGSFSLDTTSGCYVLSSHDGLAGTVNAAAYSPSYGVQIPCQAIDFRISTDVAGQSVWRFSIRPFA